MPLYEYECAACQAVTDIKHGFKETNSEPCPACGGALKRRFNPAGIVFKGSGFYVTDSRKPDAGASDAAKSDSASAPAASEASKPAPGGKSDAAA